MREVHKAASVPWEAGTAEHLAGRDTETGELLVKQDDFNSLGAYTHVWRIAILGTKSIARSCLWKGLAG